MGFGSGFGLGFLLLLVFKGSARIRVRVWVWFGFWFDLFVKSKKKADKTSTGPTLHVVLSSPPPTPSSEVRFLNSCATKMFYIPSS